MPKLQIKSFSTFLSLVISLSAVHADESKEASANPAQTEGIQDSKLAKPKWLTTTATMDSGFQMWFLPTISFILPGFGQYIDMQLEYGLGYSALGLAGLSLVSSADEKSIDISDLDSRDPALRRIFLGDSLFKIAGGLSSYHSFRLGAASRQAIGEYQFLANAKAESPLDLLISPFRFDHLAKSTTWIPLLTLAALVTTNGEHWNHVQFGDWAFSTGVSVGAGVGEEAVFRGFIMPFAQQYMQPFWAANLTQATLFGAAHFSSDNKAPWPQLLMGLYFGWVTKKNDWQISESIFIHTWWDVIAIASEYANTGRVDTWRLPTLEFSF